MQEWDAADGFIDSAHSVQKKLIEEADVHSSLKEIRDIMKKQLKMSYKKVTHSTMQGNSSRNLILRQQFALKLIELLSKGKTILNCDETWLGMMDFRRRKWQRRRGSKCHAITQTQPRISVIACLDTKGEIFYSLVQGNTNDKIMEIFIQKLVKRLDSIEKEWRKSTVLLFDNAAYHRSSSTMKVLEDHQVPVCFTGPNSYAACKFPILNFDPLLPIAPVELLFAALKNGNINPRNVPTSKKSVNMIL